MKTAQQMAASSTIETKSGQNLNRMISEINRLKSQVQQQADIIENLKRQAMECPVTGIPNRRAFEKSLDESLAYFKRYNRTGALLLIDVNDFKTINDSLGHVAGDAVLCHIANLLQNHIRETDFVARIGGDEFCVILREVNRDEAIHKARELAAVIESYPCTWDAREIYISSSVGVACFHEAGDKQDLVERADNSMYQEKSVKDRLLSSI